MNSLGTSQTQEGEDFNYSDHNPDLPPGVDAVLGKDGTTTYHHRGHVYDNLEDVPAPHWKGIDKAGEFAGNLIQSSPTLRTVLPAVGNVLSKIPPLPGEEQFAKSAGDSAEMWGVDRRVGEAVGYLAYPGLGEIRPAGKFLNNIAETVFNANRRGNSLIDAGTGAVIRNNDGVINNDVFKMTGGLMTPGGQKHVLGERHRLFDNPSRVYRSGKYKSKLYELLNQQNLLGQAEEVLTNLDEYKTTQNFGGKYNPDRPTTGFKGKRTVEYIDSAGNPSEVGWRWSFTAGDYVPYDVQKRLALVARRSNWNVNRSSKSAQYANKIFSNAREQNQAVKQALENLRQENPEYFWKIMGENYDTTKGVIYVEHINPQKSPVWIKQPDGSFRHRVSGIAPRDAGNLVIVPGPEFGILKTKIESILYAPSRLEKGAGNYLDFDRKRRVLILRDVNGRRIGDISSITNPENAQKAIDAALRGHTIKKGIEGDWQEVIQADPKIPSHIDALDEISDWKGRF